MSELLQVAAALRKLSDHELRQMALERNIDTSGMRDFFDLAESISSSKSIASAISSLPRSTAIAFEALAGGQQTNPENAARLRQLGLADESGIFFSVGEVFAGIKVNTGPNLEVAPTQVHSPDSIAAECGLSAYETLQALTELVFDLEQRYVREVGKGNVGLPDIKRLANHLKRSNEYAREIFNLAKLANLMSLVAGRWQLGPNAPKWLTSNPEEQIAILWQVWLDGLGASAADEISSLLGQTAEPQSIRRIFDMVYPFADSNLGTKVENLERLTALIGLVGMGHTAPWFKSVISDSMPAALNEIKSKLPAQGARLICQADLSLIATGPLPISVEIDLRKFAEIEVIGMASTYRLTALSITHGLESGLRESGIRGLLEKLSGTKLPQPVDYLIRETVSRFGRLSVRSSNVESGSLINSADHILLTEILNDTDLKAFALMRDSEGALFSRFDAEVLYFGLREAGYAAIRLDSNGKVVSPLKVIAAAPSVEKTDGILLDIARMRNEENKVGSDLVDDDIQRKIQLAIKNKARAEVTVITNSGDHVTFLLDPVGVANGRLRAKDKKADIERTLPIASIISVAIK